MRRFGLRRSGSATGRAGPESDIDLAELRRTDEQLDAVRRRGKADSDDPVLSMLGALAADVDAGDTPSAPTGERVRTTRRTFYSVAATGSVAAACVAAAVVVASGVGPTPAVTQVFGDSGRVVAASSVDEIRASLVHARSALDAGQVNEAQRALRRAQVGWAALGSRQADHPDTARAIRSVQADLEQAKRTSGSGGSAGPTVAGGSPDLAESSGGSTGSSQDRAGGSAGAAEAPAEGVMGEPAPTGSDAADGSSGSEPTPTTSPSPSQPGGTDRPDDRPSPPGGGRDLPDDREGPPGDRPSIPEDRPSTPDGGAGWPGVRVPNDGRLLPERQSLPGNTDERG